MGLFDYTKNVLTVILLLLFTAGAAQNDTITRTDSIKRVENDFFEHLEAKKDKNAFNRFIHKHLYKESKSESAKRIAERTRINRKSFRDAEGKIIRNIHINALKPFGYSVEDSTKKPQKYFEKSGNRLHTKTRGFVIRNYLTYRKHDRVDSTKILESERLLREESFIRDVLTDYVVEGDSVDLYITARDSWSIIPGGSISGSRIGISLREKNFVGLGHIATVGFKQNYKEGKNSFNSAYEIPNIHQTFIRFRINYVSNEDDEYTKGIMFERKFFTPNTRWAGGAFIGQTAYLDSVKYNDEFVSHGFRYNVQDYWGGYAFRFFNEGELSEKRLSNLVLSARYLKIDFTKPPPAELDPINFYSDEEYYLFGLGVTERDYVPDRYIRYYDVIEDIAVGASYSTTMGVQRKNGRKRFYLDWEAKKGNYFKHGYLGYGLKYGGFIDRGITEESVFTLSGIYFTNLLDMNPWKFRGFFSTDLVIGKHRADSRGDRLTLNDNSSTGISGFSSWEVIGTKKWVNNFVIQSYAPYEFVGFRLSPFFHSSLGLIADDERTLMKGSLYAKVGLGVLFTNDYWAFSQFKVSFAWYNSIPGVGESILKTNAFGAYDYRLMDFEFGKPMLIEYNPDRPN